MRRVLLAAAVGITVLAMAGSGMALERTKTLAQVGDVDRDAAPWGSVDFCTLSYYNYCSGWVYVWSGWSPSDVIGIEIHTAECGPKALECRTLAAAWIYMVDSYPTYGFTAAGGCARWGDQPGHLGEVTYLEDPHEWYTGWNLVDMANCHIGEDGYTIVHWVNAGPMATYTDARPLNCNPGDGSPPCMTCPQPWRSWYFGTLDYQFSGSPFYAGYYFPTGNDLFWDIIVSCIGPTAVQPSSWGNIKAIYN
jgi:hypothetical protein